MGEQRLITINCIMGQMARWIVEQSPFKTARGVDRINQAMFRYSGTGGWEIIGPSRQFRTCWFDNYRDVERWIFSALHGDEDASAWLARLNTAYRGHFSNPDAAGFAGSSRFEEPVPAYNFIDIDALVRNVAMSVWRDAEEFSRSA